MRRSLHQVGFFACTILLLSAVIAQARLAKVGDLPASYEYEHIDIEVDAKGHSKMIREILIRVHNDEGREKQSLQTVSFNGRAEKLKILAARTITGAKSQPVDLKKYLEIKDIGDFGRAFDRIKQAAITYPNVQIGSKVYLKYELTRHEPAIDGFFSIGALFGGDWIESLRLNVRSKLPLHFWKNDPNGFFAIEASPHEVRVKSLKPLDRVTTQEENSYIRPERSTYLVITSLKDWKQFASEKIPTHEKLLTSPLPPALEKIRAEAAKETGAADRLRRLVALVSQEFRYFGDWRRRNGGYTPRTLQEIDDTRYGDCKDMSLAVAAIARALGMKAHMAWIWRGQYPVFEAAYALPVDGFFNHAIARVEAEGRVYWIDATNPVSFVHDVFADIADRPAFIVDASSPRLEKTPAVLSSSGEIKTSLVYEMQPDATLQVAGEMRLSGRGAISMTIDSFYNAPAAVNHELVRNLAAQGKVLEYTVGDFERGSRIVKDLAIPVRFRLSDIGLRTSAGFGFPLQREEVVSSLLTDTKDRFSDVYLDIPAHRRSEQEVKGVRRIGKSNLDCELDSEWAALSRKVTDTSDGVRISDHVEVKKPVIPNETLQTPAFAKFQAAIRECFHRSAVILERR